MVSRKARFLAAGRRSRRPGFPLVGGRLDYLARRPVAALVYQRAEAHDQRLRLAGPMVRAGDGSSYTVRGFHVRHWIRDGMSFWAVSDLNDAELGQLCTRFRPRDAVAAFMVRCHERCPRTSANHHGADHSWVNRAVVTEGPFTLERK